ncbi:MAG: hypothetical protein ACJ8DU_02965 [Microvirga sp.]
MRELHVNLLELDELWRFVGKKQKRLTPADSAERGDAYTFVAPRRDLQGDYLLPHRLANSGQHG